MMSPKKSISTRSSTSAQPSLSIRTSSLSRAAAVDSHSSSTSSPTSTTPKSASSLAAKTPSRPKTKSAYDAPNSPIASASRPTRTVSRLRKPPTPAMADAPQPSTPTSTKSIAKNLNTMLAAESKYESAPAPLPSSLAQSNSAHPHHHPGTHTLGTTSSTLFSPAYQSHLEEQKKLAAAAPAKRAPSKRAAAVRSTTVTRSAARAAAAAANTASPASPASPAPTRTVPAPAPVPAPSPAVVPACAPTPQVSATALTPYPQQQEEDEDMSQDDYVEEQEFDPFLFIKNLPPLSPAMKNRKSILPKKSRNCPPISLALDLDETLVHCSVQPLERAELTFSVNFNGTDYEVCMRTRPHLKEFLEQVSQWFEVIVFTASQKVYADKLLNILDPQKKYIKHRVFRDSCVCVDGNYLKDLHILGRDMRKVAIVDNSVQAFGFQLDNGIPIESWFDDDKDTELLNLLPFLRSLKDVEDVRPLIRSTFRLSEFVNSL